MTRDQTAGRARVFGSGANVCGRALGIIVILSAVYFALASAADARGPHRNRAAHHDVSKGDPRCNGGGRYQAMAEGDYSGWGKGHACQ